MRKILACFYKMMYSLSPSKIQTSKEGLITIPNVESHYSFYFIDYNSVPE